MGTTIADQANEVKAAAAASQLPAELVAVFASDQAALAAGGIPAGAVSVGDKLTPFALPDASGKTRTLDELTAQGPAVIVFYRGGGCPYCNVTLRTYQRDLVPHLGGYSARLVAISPETPDASLTTQEKAELTYTVLSDAGAELAASIGISFEPSEDGLAAQRKLGVDIRTTRSDGNTVLPMPSVLIVDRDHVVRFVDIHPDYTGRTEVSDILAALDTLTTNRGDPMHATSGTDDKARVGDAFPTLQLAAISGQLVTVPDPAGDYVHLQLRRFAGCPICNLHLRSIVTRHDEIRAHGIGEVVVFHSTAAELAKHEAELPFPLIADPERVLYRRLGVERRPTSLLSPRALRAAIAGLAAALTKHSTKCGALGPVKPTGGRLGLPADFLIAPDGRITALKYGRHAYDQWTVDELLEHVRPMPA